MKKINIIKKQIEINNVIKNGKLLKNKYFYLYYIYNKEKENINLRFCVCVAKKIGNAVRRNKNKRQIKDIIDKNNFMFPINNDYVIILRNEIDNISYDEKTKYLLEILCKLKGDKNE